MRNLLRFKKKNSSTVGGACFVRVSVFATTNKQTTKQTNCEWCLCSECIMFYDVMVVVEVVVEVVPYFPILWNVGTESRVLLLISKSGKRSKENIDWMEKIWFSKKMLLVNCNF